MSRDEQKVAVEQEARALRDADDCSMEELEAAADIMDGVIAAVAMSERRGCEIHSFMWCSECLRIPGRVQPALDVGWTPKGLQVWCTRHDRNVVNLDFLGQKVQTRKVEGTP